MRKAFSITVLSLVAYLGFGQLSRDNLQTMQQYEQELSALSDSIVNGRDENVRGKACFTFIPKLVEALKTPESFHYPFDSLETISILNPDDNSFRLFTWQLRRDNGAYRYYGAIQMNTEELKLHPLFDYSDSLYNPLDSVLDNETWFGALYYNIHEYKHRRKKYYTLFGWDGHDLMSDKKVLEVLHFEDDKPVFGAPVFQFEEDSITTYTQHRFILEFREGVAAGLNYYESEGKIIYDHLIPPEEKLEGLEFTYIPDGTYEGFELDKGNWVHIDKVFHYAINEFDNPPVPKPKDFDKEGKPVKAKPQEGNKK